jgi:hypothetical protein
VLVAAFAVRTTTSPPLVTITATCRRIRSFTSSGRRAHCPSPQRYSVVTFCPSTVLDQPLPECIDHRHVSLSRSRTGISDHGHHRLLGARRIWPGNPCAAEHAAAKATNRVFSHAHESRPAMAPARITTPSAKR